MRCRLFRAAAVLAATAGAAYAAPVPVVGDGAATAPVKASAKAPAAAAAKAPVAATAKAQPKPAAGLPAPAAVPAELPLTQAQLDLSDLVLLGDIDCDMKQRVSLWPVPSRPGHFELRFGKAVFTMVPHETASGAVRLEDAGAGVVWLQIPVKSMLLDARKGLRLADGCLHTAQRHEQADAASAPTAAPGLGITDLQR